MDGILHCIAHANTEDLRNDFIKTSRDGFAHACDVSAYSLIAVSNIAKEKQMLNPKASIVTLTYFGAEKNQVTDLLSGAIINLDGGLKMAPYSAYFLA